MTEQKLNADGRKRIREVFITLLIMGVVLFLIAGRLNWVWAWAYLGIYFASLLVNMLVVLRVSPETINQRGRKPENQKEWDKRLIKIYGPVAISVLVIAALDGGRFGWSGELPLWLQLTAMVVGFLGYSITSWAMRHNAFLAQQVAVQKEAGHKVATTGPYALVRHPMYISMIVGNLTTPLILGSYWAMIPSTIAAILIILRTSLEDQTLQAELDGYGDYAAQVKYRFVPGLW